jgi:hypothetical protein
MRRRAAFLLLGISCGLTLSGCFLTSMQPFYERGKTMFDPALLGTWHMENCSDSDENKGKYCVITLTAYEQSKDGKTDKGYSIAFRDERGLASEFDGFLFELNGVRFLDTAVDEGPKVDVAFAVHAVTAHVLWKAALSGQSLELTPMRRSLAREAAAAQPPLAIFQYEGDTILSAPTAEVQAWLAKYAMDPGSYEKPLSWKKGPPPGAAKPAARKK